MKIMIKMLWYNPCEIDDIIGTHLRPFSFKFLQGNGFFVYFKFQNQVLHSIISINYKNNI